MALIDCAYNYPVARKYIEAWQEELRAQFRLEGRAAPKHKDHFYYVLEKASSSLAQTREEAMAEWELDPQLNLERDGIPCDVRKCICRKTMDHWRFIKNRQNGNILVVGSTCIKKYLEGLADDDKMLTLASKHKGKQLDLSRTCTACARTCLKERSNQERCPNCARQRRPLNHFLVIARFGADKFIEECSCGCEYVKTWEGKRSCLGCWFDKQRYETREGAAARRDSSSSESLDCDSSELGEPEWPSVAPSSPHETIHNGCVLYNVPHYRESPCYHEPSPVPSLELDDSHYQPPSPVPSLTAELPRENLTSLTKLGVKKMLSCPGCSLTHEQPLSYPDVYCPTCYYRLAGRPISISNPASTPAIPKSVTLSTCGF